MSTAITYSRYGAPDVLTVTSADIPQPGPGQVLVRFGGRRQPDRRQDPQRADGRRLPGPVPGPAWVGRGRGGGGGRPGAGPGIGDEVFGVASVGGYSQLALLDRPVAKPDGLSWEAAAPSSRSARRRSGCCGTWG